MNNYIVVGSEIELYLSGLDELVNNEIVFDYVKTLEEVNISIDKYNKAFEDHDTNDLTAYRIFPLQTVLYVVRWLGTLSSVDKVFKSIEELREFANRLYFEENADDDDNGIYFDEDDFDEIRDWLEEHDDYAVSMIELDKI